MTFHTEDRLDRARVLHEELLAEEERWWDREDRLHRHSDQSFAETPPPTYRVSCGGSGVPRAGSENWRSSRSAPPAALREPSPSSIQPAAPSAAPEAREGTRAHSVHSAVTAQRNRPSRTETTGPDACSGRGMGSMPVRNTA